MSPSTGLVVNANDLPNMTGSQNVLLVSRYFEAKCCSTTFVLV